jgi:hemin uptake protein HemP
MSDRPKDGARTSDRTVFAREKLRIDSVHLFRGSNEIVIVHQNQEYNLRITKSGKLILTK